MKKISLKDAFSSFDEHWKPVVAAQLNGQEVKLVKFRGPFVWHRHDEADEMFLVVKGRFVMELRGGSATVEEGEFIIVPKGIEHRPVAAEEVHVLLFEPAGTLNTGNVLDEYTVKQPERLSW
jgi:mannose-6-phosphate isomerase-like protein (cupin superfamily)